METKDKVNKQEPDIDKCTENKSATENKKNFLENAAKVAETASKLAKSVSNNENIVGIADKVENVAKFVSDKKLNEATDKDEKSSKIVADLGKNAVKGAVKGGIAFGSKGILSTIIGFFTANIPAVLITAAIGATIAGGAYFINDMNKPLLIENTANIVEEVKKISEFTTACYFEESVIQDRKFTTKKQWFGNENDTIENTIVLTVLCKVRAGYDLSAIADNDFIVKGDTVNIKLPAPKIFDVISNPSDYKIFEEIGKWEHDEVVLMQKQAKERMLQNALDQKILEKANNIGKERIKTLFATFGFNVVNVTLTDVPVREKAPATEIVEEQIVIEQAEPVVTDSLAVAESSQIETLTK